ncbi:MULTISPECIES: hypothetical protein [Streptomyces]|uniref:Integral membrane protein n=1 Tax=Streptomyces coelicolor (strain ATCC BAA-471 / A3(2) / M145) TaxID=100226 RepID=Q9KXQ3_STRCO|nr:MULTISPECIES: hypothetical protein [Streptomyces]MDX2926987.1 hypothetical protein [Streptomyces sp. NRRL_B-16638]MYU41021.1 hypothetical protein [Streptomyces sp. SID7813]NSL83752.1 hypothetical protein [Streptomyces coelicolor]QFI41704.1 hypothetical protein FQ762_07560 [Streptomyces coelicolor A3(2)]QKN65354.1 hypothetical protein HCU77_07320 [Streptomyces coelicolor]
MYTGVPLASAKTQIFEAVLGFLPDWVQITVLALIVLAVVAGWVVKVRRRLVRRRASRAGLPLPVAARQGTGADHLGAYPPPQPGQSGADFLGPYAPAQRQESGADFLGAYAPARQQDDRPA